MIHKIDFSQNKVVNISPITGQLYSLKSLDLRQNLISDVPKTLLHLPSLTYLNLSGKPLTKNSKKLLESSKNNNFRILS